MPLNNRTPTSKRNNVSLEVVLVDDDEVVLNALSFLLVQKGHEVHSFTDPFHALAFIENQSKIDMIVCDFKMPTMDGIAFFTFAQQINPSIRRVLASGYKEFDVMVLSSLNNGTIEHFLLKPISSNAIDIVFASAGSTDTSVDREKALANNCALSKAKEALNSLQEFHGIYTSEPSMLALLASLKSFVKINAPIFIQGESGTGKELLARALHAKSSRAQHPFVAVNCATFTQGLLESQLFGHKKGAFTSANANQVGLFEAAEGGTLFLDEVTEIDIALQAKLFRVLQEREYLPIGEVTPRKFNIQIISAASVSLDEVVAKGTFRRELKYRLEVIPIKVPPLRDRPSDIFALFIHFLSKALAAEELEIAHLDEDIPAALQRHSWPGNVRELQNLCTYLAALTDQSGLVLKSSMLPDYFQNDYPKERHRGDRRADRRGDHWGDRKRAAAATARTDDVDLQEFANGGLDDNASAEELKNLLKKYGGNRSALARGLGISRMTLWRHLKKLEL